jgi:GT2 family glycosyltransferase
VTQDERAWDKEIVFNVNLGFAAGCNAGAAVATRPILCFMNNDSCFVDVDTPAKLLAALDDKHPIVAPYSNRAKPPQGDIAREQTPQESKAVDMVVGLCMMLPKELFWKVGGFDPDLLTYEDDQFCRKAAGLGYGSKVVGGTWVEHERHETFKKLGLDVNLVMAKNREIFKKKNPVIRVIVIAKDEEKALPGFLKQWEPVTRDWCVLDTGSTDKTIEVAKNLGCQVKKGPFEDFAAARNMAVKKFGEGADWIIMIDPDERMDGHMIAHLKEFLYRTAADILYSPLEAKYPDGSVRKFVSKPFCWRNLPDIKWVFKVHEKLVGSLKQAIVTNSMNTHIIELHEDGRRQKASGLYDGLMKAEPYFTDPKHKAKMIQDWPILDYDRPDDVRIAKVVIGPLISVVIPTYKRGDLLNRAILSAMTQDYENLEVVVVGDNCPDLERMIAAMAHPRVRMFNLKKNHGAGGAVPRNHAIAAAGGSLIAYLDDDNFWKPGHVSSLYEGMRASGTSYAFSSMEVDGVDLKFAEPRQGNIDTSCILHQKDLVAKHGGWKDREAGGYYHDWEFVSRWVKAGEKCVATKKPTLVYNAETCGQKDFLKALAAKVGKSA